MASGKVIRWVIVLRFICSAWCHPGQKAGYTMGLTKSRSARRLPSLGTWVVYCHRCWSNIFLHRYERVERFRPMMQRLFDMLKFDSWRGREFVRAAHSLKESVLARDLWFVPHCSSPIEPTSHGPCMKWLRVPVERMHVNALLPFIKSSLLG